MPSNRPRSYQRGRETAHLGYEPMNEPSHRDALFARLPDAIRLPRPQGWAVPAVRWLTVWFLGNVGWIVGGLATSVHLPGFRPPPGLAYWSLWCVAGGAVLAGPIPVLARVRPTGWQSWLWFGVLALAMCLLEEALCYLTGTGMWEGRSRFWPEFGVGVSVLMGWAIGSGLVLRFSGLGVWEALLLCGFSGWLAEAFVVPRFIGAPCC